MKNSFKNLFDNKLIFLGIFMFSLYIYFRFVKERLPRNIPFSLTAIGFIILVEICCIYTYILFRTVKPAKTSNEIVTKLIDVIFKPLNKLDSFIKELPFVRDKYPTVIYYMANKLAKESFYKIFDIIFFFIPRIILICTFIIDIFYFGKLFYIYKVIYLGLLLILRRYILYSIKKFNTKLTLELKPYIECIGCKYEYGIHPSEWPENFDPEEDDDEDDTMALPYDIYLKYYIKQKVYKNIELSSTLIVKTKHFFDQYNIIRTISGSFVKTHTDCEDYIKREKRDGELDISFRQLLKVLVLEESYNYSVSKSTFLKSMKIIIYALYLICWLYILVVSIHKLNTEEFFQLLNITWKTIKNPFL